MFRLRILTLFTITIAAAIFFFKKRNPTTVREGDGLVIPKAWLSNTTNSQTPTADQRPPDQTFLTFPEWYLVFSPEEQAQYFKTHTATSFPFMSHTAQIWQSYAVVKDQIRDNFAPNPGYHFMIKVIGSSATAEYAIKAFYETLIGRITDTKEVITDEDKFNAQFTQDYTDFIKDTPWYEYDFSKQLSTLWNGTSIVGSNPLRKLERRYILTSELAVKALYGKLIKMGTKTVYEEALLNTEVVIDSVGSSDSIVGMIKKFPDGSALFNLPRYDKFSTAAVELAEKGYRFREIAGNKSAILLTVLTVSKTPLNLPNTRIVFTQPLPSIPDHYRIALAVQVMNLHTLLKQLHQGNIEVEHIFDY